MWCPGLWAAKRLNSVNCLKDTGYYVLAPATWRNGRTLLNVLHGELGVQDHPHTKTCLRRWPLAQIPGRHEPKYILLPYCPFGVWNGLWSLFNHPSMWARPFWVYEEAWWQTGWSLQKLWHMVQNQPPHYCHRWVLQAKFWNGWVLRLITTDMSKIVFPFSSGKETTFPPPLGERPSTPHWWWSGSLMSLTKIQRPCWLVFEVNSENLYEFSDAVCRNIYPHGTLRNILYINPPKFRTLMFGISALLSRMGRRRWTRRTSSTSFVFTWWSVRTISLDASGSKGFGYVMVPACLPAQRVMRWTFLV